MNEDQRFGTPLYTLAEIAWYLNVPKSSMARWAKRRTVKGSSLVTHIANNERRQAGVPFIGLAEAYVIAAFKRHTKRLRMQYVLDVLADLEAKSDVEHLLASQRLALHGHQMLVNMSNDPSRREFVEALTKNRVLDKVVEGNLKFLDYAADGFARRLKLPITEEPLIEMNPNRAFGQPVFIRGGGRMVDVLDRFNAGDAPAAIASDFRLSEAEVLDTLRAFTKRAAEAA